MKILHGILPIIGLLAVTSCAVRPYSVSQVPLAPIKPELPGQRADGSVLLPNQWSLRPAGRQIVLEDFPVNVAVHPGGEYAAVLHCGYSQHAIVIVKIASAEVVSRVALDEAFYGLEFSRDGRTLFSSGAGGEVIHRFAFKDGFLSDHHEIVLRNVKERGVPAGLAVDDETRRVYVANLWGHRITKIDLADETRPTDILIGTNAVEVVKKLSRPPSDPDVAAATKRAEAALDPTTPSDPFPYACRIDERRQRLYVSLWAQASVAVIDLKSGEIIARWPTQEHPSEMLLTTSGKHLYVANANRNTVTVLDTESGLALETISAALFPNSPPGATPMSLAMSPDGKFLFIANATVNCIAVFDVSTPGKSRSLGFIPAGWYPTSVRVTPDGKHLLVANGKGIISKANPHGPRPIGEPSGSVVEYIAALLKGTLSVIDLPKDEKLLEKQMNTWTVQVLSCSPLRADAVVTAIRPKDNPVPDRVGNPSPIKYVLYIIKENRTYDQVLGDIPQGNGDPGLCIFPERVTPNLHKLAREFVLLDNFYVDSEVSADGHEWTMGAYATDFVEKHWPMSYGHGKRGKYPYPSEGQFKLAFPAGGYLWDRACEAGVTYRSYGEFVAPGKKDGPARARVKALQGHIDEWYHCWDLDYPDVKRAERFIAELNRFEKEGEMPRLQVLRLPNDHTCGTAAGKLTPMAQVADNDVALGMLVGAVSRSSFWPRTAIFVIEDDAQNGSDHVDCHRSTAFVISPYVRRGSVDSTMYSTSSMLRTMELILGLQPMSQFDAAATPMFNCFQARLDAAPYNPLPANVDLNERNVKTAWGGELSKKMNFAMEDAADDLVLNEVIWRSIRGSGSPMPRPVRAAFVRVLQKEDDDD